MCSVTAAAWASVVYPSSMSSSGGPTTEIWKKWSITHRDASPLWSASRATARQVAPVAAGASGQVKRLTCSPSLMPPSCLRTGGRRHGGSEVLTRVGDGVDRLAGLGALLGLDEGADVHDPLPLLAGDAGPVVGVGRVREVLVLAELVGARLEQVLDAQPPLPGVEEVLDRHLLRAVDDVLDH